MRGTALVAVAGALAAAALALEPARAQSADAALQACVANDSGRLRVVPAGAACKTRETSRLLALAPDASACRVVARLTLPNVAGEGPGGAMNLYAYEVAVDAAALAGGPPTFSPLEVTKTLDSASVALFQAAVAGTHFATGRLEVLGSGGVVSQAYDLTDVLVASVKLGVSPRCPESLTEDLSFSFATLAPGAGG
jgi:hypothetical protein